jgi:acyl carrier protein
MSISSEVLSFIAQQFHLDSKQVNLDTRATDVKGWDSITHLELILNLEEKYNIEFTASELALLNNVGNLVELIITKTQAK